MNPIPASAMHLWPITDGVMDYATPCERDQPPALCAGWCVMPAPPAIRYGNGDLVLVSVAGVVAVRYWFASCGAVTLRAPRLDDDTHVSAAAVDWVARAGFATTAEGAFVPLLWCPVCGEPLPPEIIARGWTHDRPSCKAKASRATKHPTAHHYSPNQPDLMQPIRHPRLAVWPQRGHGKATERQNGS